jgi:2-aminobenzoate-CoA ligase
MIVSSGYNIAGPELEAGLLGHPDILECAVIGVPDTERGQIVQAYVVLAEGLIPDDSCIGRLQDYAKAQIAPYKYPRSICSIDALPKTATGKVQRFRLKNSDTLGE